MVPGSFGSANCRGGPTRNQPRGPTRSAIFRASAAGHAPKARPRWSRLSKATGEAAFGRVMLRPAHGGCARPGARRAGSAFRNTHCVDNVGQRSRESGERGQREHPLPVEIRTRIDLAARRDIGMADGEAQSIAPAQGGHRRREPAVLALGEAMVFVADHLDPYGEVVAGRSLEQARDAGMPGAVVAGDELGQVAAPTDQEMRGHAQAVETAEARISAGVEPVAEEVLDAGRRETTWRQADEMDDDCVDFP